MTIDVPGREGDLARLRTAYARAARADGAGQTLYVTGAPGSGRTALLRAFAGELAARDDAPTLLAGGFENGRFVSWDDSGPPPQRVTAIVERVVSLPAALVPFAALVGSALSRGEAPLAFVRTLFEAGELRAPAQFMAQLMGEVAGEGPVVLLVDDADHAPGGLWGDVVLELAEQVAGDRPLLFVLAIERPAQLDRHEDDEPESLYVARTLRGRVHARWVTLDLVTIEDIEAWSGPAAPDVLERLLDVTGGRAAWAARLWQHWRASGVIVAGAGEADAGADDADGADASADADPDAAAGEAPAQWRFAAGGRERTLEPFEDVLGARLAQLVGGDETIDGARALLAHGALEGPVFTAEAIARVLRRDRDEVIDLLDDMLVHDDEHPTGVVHETGSIVVDDQHGAKRHLWLYRFTHELDWLTLAHRGLGESQRRAAARDLARALVDVYGGPHYVAGTLARLYELAGDEAPARRYRQMADAGADRDVVRWRAEALLARPAPADRADRRRDAQAMLAIARRLSSSGPHADSLRFAQAAYRLAPLREDRAEALHLAGVAHFKLGVFEDATHTLNLALALSRELGDRKGEADARAALALILARQGGQPEARTELSFVLDAYRLLGERDAESATRQSLVHLDLALGEPAQARGHLVAMLLLTLEDENRRAEAGTRLQIARLDMEQGGFDEARRQLDAALAIYQELGDRHGEADARHNLARLGIELGSLDEARREFMRVLGVYKDLGDKVGEAATRHSLAAIAMEQRVYEKARRELKAVLVLGQAMEDEDVVQTALEGLEVVDAVDPPRIEDD